jgi:hypothetical protein
MSTLVLPIGYSTKPPCSYSSTIDPNYMVQALTASVNQPCPEFYENILVNVQMRVSFQ